jgi:hypothetical protein
MTKITYSAFGRHFSTPQEAEAYGRGLMGDASQWTLVEAPTSFIVFIQSERCLPAELWRVHS